MIPGAPGDGRHARQLGIRRRVGFHQRQLPFFRAHQQHVLIGEQQELPAQRGAAPFARAVVDVQAYQAVSEIPVGVAAMHHEIVEIRGHLG